MYNNKKLCCEQPEKLKEKTEREYRMRKFVIVYLLLFLWSLMLPLSARAQEFYASGHIAERGKTIKIKDSIAVWNAKKKELKVYFYPFKLTQKDFKEYPGFIAFHKSSPDKALWGWCPYGAVSIKFEEEARTRKLETINWANFIMYGFIKKNYTMNINRNGQEAKDSFDTFAITSSKGQEILTTSTKGEYASFSNDSKYSWDLKVHTKVILKKGENQ